ncbi:UdgX family uracil-DNA binding protein [Saccharopolyspora sp. HNM0986]|uniref:UdgX family uracil-DNA binding protein n=1 Tax=Saccharopolyspora galaxeae TaxID=2781241 RepID=UPI00190A82FD|nr:UdgX family uracil-DNA binding protein [Saccharopolyspora sp. HNM0986]MBK0869941.1 UdgX family uracil-DNA binding protein [Saccharopolyspora sp. HNM0986]
MSAEPYVPARARLPGLRKAVQSCAGCALHRDATQAVFGSGSESARLVLVGEQPGDQEDRKGQPFSGPAGGLLDRALERAGIDRDDAYVTNATKHFKFSRQRGKRRIHQKPNRSEVAACWPWLAAELRVVDPDLVVCLGATAAQTLLGTTFRLTRSRGRLVDLPESALAGHRHGPARALATIHPSAVLRADDSETELEGLVNDLRVAAEALAPTPG